MRAVLRLAVPLVAVSLLSACAVAPRGGYSPVGTSSWPDPYSTTASAAQGTVTRIEMGQGGGRADGTGAVVGGLVGAAVGRGISSDVTKGYRQRNVGTVVGALVGAAIGHTLERETKGGNSFRVTVALDRGGSVTLEQRDLGDLRVGDRVRVEQDRVVRGAAADMSSEAPVSRS